MKKNILSSAILIGLIISSCNNETNEDVTEQVNKNGSVETAVTVQHIDSTNDVLITKHALWVKGTQYKNIEYRDTVPALGMENTEAENQDGETKKVSVKKDYEIFITVK